jgi:hypothetical protein
MNTPKWTPTCFERHYRKHPFSPQESECWCRVTGETCSPISRDRYRSESESVIKNAWLVFDAGYQETSDCDTAQRRNYYDRRCCFTAVDLAREDIRTCFHAHCDGWCEVSDSIAAKTKLLSRCIRKKTAYRGKLTDPRIKKCVIDPAERRYLATLLAELQAPSRTRSSR